MSDANNPAQGAAPPAAAPEGDAAQQQVWEQLLKAQGAGGMPFFPGMGFPGQVRGLCRQAKSE